LRRQPAKPEAGIPLDSSPSQGYVERERREEKPMSDDALFLGWGQVVRGREEKAVSVFNESIEYYGRLQQEGKLESVEPWFLQPHGGDLEGFIILRGEPAQLDEILRSPEFERLQARVGMIVDRLGIVPAVTGSSLARGMGQFQEAIGDLGG
jgi:hypothetical protein